MKLFYFSRIKVVNRGTPLITGGVLEADDEGHAATVLASALAVQGWPDSVSEYGFTDLATVPKQEHGVLCIGVIHIV